MANTKKQASVEEVESKVLKILTNTDTPVEVDTDVEVVFVRPSYSNKLLGESWADLKIRRQRRQFQNELDELVAKYGENTDSLEANEDYRDIQAVLNNYAIFFRYFGVLNNHVNKIFYKEEEYRQKPGSKKFLLEDFVEEYYYDAETPLGDADTFITNNVLNAFVTWENNRFVTPEEVKN